MQFAKLIIVIDSCWSSVGRGEPVWSHYWHFLLKEPFVHMLFKFVLNKFKFVISEQNISMWNIFYNKITKLSLNVINDNVFS